MAAKETKNVNLSSKNLLDSDDHLDDATESEFTGVTLSISADNDLSPLNSNADTRNTVTPADNSANVATNNSNTCNTVSTTWQIPPFNQSLSRGRGFFAVREGAFESAVESCQPVILENLDGNLQGGWLLTEIDHWDNEKERVVLITEKTLLLIKYDFIVLRILEYRRLYLKDFDCIVHGDISYPEKSLMPKRKGRAVRAMWNKGRPIQFSQNWNPWSKEIPFITFTSHRLLDTEAVRERKNYDIENFHSNFIQAVQNIQSKMNVVPCVLKEEPVLIENYVGLVSVVHNAVDLGFFKSRGRVKSGGRQNFSGENYEIMYMEGK